MTTSGKINDKITINDIARRANVSISTVSRVLRGTTPVSPDKREAVLAAVADLDYQPNVHASSLASGRSTTVGVLTQNVGSPVYDAILQGVMDGLKGSRFTPLFADGQWEPAGEKRAIDILLGRQVDGFILIGSVSPLDDLRALQARVPVVIVGREIPHFPGINLYVDNFEAARQATRFLIDEGHQTIAHISGPLSHEDAVRRLEGYRQAVADAGLPLDDRLVFHGDFRRRSGLDGMAALLARAPGITAVFAANDQMASGARLHLYRQGVGVPEAISLVGFDDQPGTAYMIPPLTTVSQPARQMGEAAAQAILNRLDERPADSRRFVAELVLRESTAPPAGSDD